MQDTSHSKIGVRVPKSKEHPLGWQEVDVISPDSICLVALPGSHVKDGKKANGFAKMIEETIEDKNIPIYCAQYDFGNRNFRVDREAVLARYGQEDYRFPFIDEVSNKDKTYIPQYVHDLYQKILSPRLRDEQGNRLPISKVAQRLNKIVFANHCFGSSVYIQLEHLLKKDMTKLGYTKNIQNYLLKQIHSVNVAPVSPYGITKTTAFKFISLSDEKVTSVHTPQIEHALNRRHEHECFLAQMNSYDVNQKNTNRPFTMNFSLFRPTENEVVFAVNNIYPLEIRSNPEYEGIEHTFDSYADKDDDWRTKQGDQISKTFHTTLNFLIKHAKSNDKELTEMPNIFKSEEFSDILKRTQKNRYDLITKEISLIKSR